jgi:hypothetical protein
MMLPDAAETGRGSTSTGQHSQRRKGASSIVGRDLTSARALLRRQPRSGRSVRDRCRLRQSSSRRQKLGVVEDRSRRASTDRRSCSEENLTSSAGKSTASSCDTTD